MAPRFQIKRKAPCVMLLDEKGNEIITACKVGNMLTVIDHGTRRVDQGVLVFEDLKKFFAWSHQRKIPGEYVAAVLKLFEVGGKKKG